MGTIPSMSVGDAGGGGTAGSGAGGTLRAWPHAVGTGTVAAARARMCPGLQLGALATPLTLEQGGSRRAGTALSPGDSRAEKSCTNAGSPPALGWGSAWQHRGSITASSCPVPCPHRCPALGPASSTNGFGSGFFSAVPFGGDTHTAAPRRAGARGALVLPTASPNLLDTEEHVCFCFSTFVHFPPVVQFHLLLSVNLKNWRKLFGR